MPAGFRKGRGTRDQIANIHWITQKEREFLEKEMATHSNILAWRIPWTEEPGELQSMGSQRVGHNWSDLARTVEEHIVIASYDRVIFRELNIVIVEHFSLIEYNCLY